MPQLCLGTAQFGMSYGITNATGQVLKAEVRRILDFFFKRVLNYLIRLSLWVC